MSQNIYLSRLTSFEMFDQFKTLLSCSISHSRTDVERQITVSPAMPVYYKYTFPSGVENVFINVKSTDNLCTVVSVQAFDCPVYDVSEIGIRQGHYQTMSTRASFNVDVSDESYRREIFSFT